MAPKLKAMKVAAKAKAKCAAKKSGLTKAQLAKTESMTLDEKINLMKDSGTEVSLKTDEWRKLNNRFSQTELKKMSPDNQKKWAELSSQKGRSGKTVLQHKVMLSYVINGENSTQFKNVMAEISMTNSHSQSTEWVSKKRILDDYDESEVEEMLECGSLEVPRNPDNKKRFQYKMVRIQETDTVTKTQAVGVRGSEAIVRNFCFLI